MNSEIIKFLEDFEKNPPAQSAMIQQVVKRINLDLPSEYLEIFSFMNGGEGFIGDNYCRLYPIEDLIPLNEAFSVKEFAPELFLFGSNVDGDAFAFNTTSHPFSILEIPFIPMDMELANLLGKTMTEFFSYFSNGEKNHSIPVNKDLIGKELHVIHPIAFGGDPLDPKNIALVPTKSYAQIVVFWNEVWHGIKQDDAK